VADSTPPADSDPDLRVVFADVTPLKQDKQSPWRAPKPLRRKGSIEFRDESKAEYSPQPERKPMAASPLEDGFFHRGGLQRKVIRKLRQGHFRPELQMDLHGYRQVTARKALEEFIAMAIAENITVVLVVHGKGFRSEQGVAVIKQLVQYELQQDSRVLAFTPATPADGGSGASYVYLKSSRQHKL
jgi:DNA-nicking Smr family endonuclease